MATTLGGVTLVDPVAAEDGQVISYIDIGGSMVMADGSLRAHYVGTRRRFDLRWVGLTEAERNAAWYGYWTCLLDSQSYSPPESTDTYTVLAVRDSWQEESFEETGTTTYYNASFSIYEEQPSSPELGGQLSDAVAVAEAVSISDVANPSLSDAVALSESVAMLVPELVPALSDSVSVAESVSAGIAVRLLKEDGDRLLLESGAFVFAE